jgi:PAS domain S-box-containing protein
MDRGIIHSDPLKSPTSSSELQLIYDTAPIGLAFVSTDCRYVMINQHLTEICGIPIANHIGRSVRETVPQVAEQVEQIVQAILRTGEPVTGIEINGQRPDGSNKDRVWITYWHPLKDPSGQVVGINVAAEEITERKRAEADLAASQEELRKINNALAERVQAQAQERDRIWSLSQDLFVVSDPALSSMLGWFPDELIGKDYEWLVHPDDLDRARSERASLTAGNKTQHLENRVMCKDGSYRWLSWFAVPDRGLIYAIGRDITNLKAAEEQLNTLRRELAAASRQATMGAMTASIAHEFRQPLAAMVSNANAALRWLRRPSPNLLEVESSLDQIVKSGHQLSEVIDSVRAMFGRDSADTSLVNVRLLVTEVLAVAQGELETHRIALHDDMSHELPEVMAAPVQLQQVILNLIMNAIEAMTSVTGRERRLTIASNVEPLRSVTIAVSDSGVGIDPAHIDRIFEPFFTTKRHGMGLGLSICRSIIEGHGGKLLVSPQRPFGTSFQLTLPIAAVRSQKSARTMSVNATA